MPRKSKKRGKGKYDKNKRVISKQKIYIETAIYRKGNILMGAVCNGRIKTEQIVNFFNGKIGEDITFCTYSHKSYPRIDKKLKLTLNQVPSRKTMIDNIYHLQHVN